MLLAINMPLHIITAACLVAAYPVDEDFQPSEKVMAEAEVYLVDRKHHKTFELIDKSTNMLGWGDPNPVAVVRAVNHLRSLGHEGAIEALREYVNYAENTISPNESNSPDQERLCCIIPLLFVPVDKDAGLPLLGRSLQMKGTAKEWEPRHIIVESDLPFHNRVIGGFMGPPTPNRRYLVEWAAKHGRLRAKPLQPANDPLRVADDICRPLKGIDKRDNRETIYHIRQQAWRTVSHLIQTERQEEWPPDKLSDDDWSKLKKQVQSLKIHWSEEDQNYVCNK